jgi:hypothetical protein
LVEKLRPFAGMQHLDVAGGTGDVAFRVLDAIQRAEAQAALPLQPDQKARRDHRGSRRTRRQELRTCAARATRSVAATR